ncbi:MAG TPA: thioredoxin domain-containing protein [Clostridia bacterium]|nr:thioredoxin domain-containing protein [Clostridia bacterium]
MPNQKKSNRLIHEKSPYLLQHAHNPVDWYPWGEEAFDKAKSEDKPIFLSIGYSTCHWCHVMEEESFQDEEVAHALSQNFISIKVDREERPDIDHIYMTICQALTGKGGWPLTVIMTPDQKPFFAGTYFPKNNRQGMTGLIELLDRIKEAWNTKKGTLLESADSILETMDLHFTMGDQQDEMSKEPIDEAYRELHSSFDETYGGFGYAPKFPSPHNLSFLLRYWKLTGEGRALDMVEKTLDGMYRGGIFDHIGYGFSRYSTDERWLVPHFEKMLYDNALLSIAYIEAYQITGKGEYARVATKIFDYIIRDMIHPEGGFYSAEDADSEGVEGKFYVWTPKEIKDILGQEDGQVFCDYYDITSRGNFEGQCIPNRTHAKEPADDKEQVIDVLRQKIFDSREKRIHPHKDDKILTSWNALMISAMAIGGRVLDKPKYTMASRKALEFILRNLINKDGRLMVRYRDGESAHLAYLEDYAYLIWTLIELYESTFEPQYLELALKNNGEMLDLFWDREKGGLFMYAEDGEQLISRPKEIYDGALPSGNSVAALNMLRLARMTGDHQIEERAYSQLNTFAKMVRANPSAHTHFLMAAMFGLYPTKEIVLSGDSKDQNMKAMIDFIHKTFLPQAIVLLRDSGSKDRALVQLAPYVENQRPLHNRATAYICENFACREPISDIEAYKKALLE